MIFERGYFDSSQINESKIEKAFADSRNFSSKTELSSLRTVFLSHKHSDLKDIKGVVGMLEKMGAKIYIDSMDNKMPEKTSGDTAIRIKDMIKFCKKFILLATDKAIESYWCNWELGVGDTYKFIDNIAILPMKNKWETDTMYNGNEYLEIYPSIYYENGFNSYRSGNLISKGFYVKMPTNGEGWYSITELGI